ncbi:MAG: RNA-binding cell elongation regulator Jag/EloR [Candidatus Fimivicinus sp.]|nr:protein jag [Oscillospiraceae bacterium]MDY5591948.1 RNA-binding cell elongation regulator Jag/EloR [Candidatus Fimivicinus sp.]
MIKEAICTGATIEEAREKALAELAAPEDIEVKIEVLEMPVKKTFGLFGGAPAKVRASYEESPAGKAIDYLKRVLEGMGIPDVTVKEICEDGHYRLDLDCGENHGAIIGRRGETLDALQYLTSLVANRSAEEYIRISLNVGDYREKRDETLRGLARKNANQVLKYGRNVTLEPMNPYERRVIHTTIQEMEGVQSHSVGSDSDRRVVISLEEGVKPTHGGGYHKGRGGRGRSGGRDSRGPRRDASSVSREKNPQEPSRTPHRDAGSAPLYGKIETKTE